VAISATLLAADAAGPIGLAIVMAGIAVTAYGEVCRVLQSGGFPVSATCGRIATGIVILAAGMGGGALLLGTLIAFPVVFLMIILTPESGRLARAYGSLGVLAHVAFPPALLVLLRARPDGFTIVAWIVLVVCFNDVMAMFGGLLAGRTPLFRKISPGKTLEGFVLGLMGALGAAALMRFAFPLPSAPVYFGASLVLALAGCAGDLAASALKRAAGAKDFGACLPGHGGVMDRLDSLLFAAPAGYLAVTLFW
jgi:phosphatidate cytidylyltransferase